jgi:hypothetical protein
MLTAMTMTTPKSEHKSICPTNHLLTTQNSFSLENTQITTYSFTSTMKLHLLLLALLFSLSSGFMTELRGNLTEMACTGEEYAEFKHCATMGVDADPIIPEDFTELEENFFVNRGGDDRKLMGWCTGCTGGAPRGTFCFTVCGGRRLSEEGMDTPNLRRLDQPDFVAEYEDGIYTGNGRAKRIAQATMECLGDVSTKNPCLGSTDTMTLIVRL